MSCDSYLQGLVIRATRLDDCGLPDYGACGTVVSEGFINIELENNETDAEEISQTLANGRRCYYVETPKLLNNVQATIELCEVDPELFEIMTGAPLVLDDAVSPEAHGFTTDSASYGVANVALEVWMNLASGGCTSGQSPRRWGYYLMPWLYQGTVGKPTIENGAVNFTISEARTRDGNQWGVGPYNIQREAVGDALSPLFTPLTSTTHDLLYKVNVAPPTPTCGCVPLVALS